MSSPTFRRDIFRNFRHSTRSSDLKTHLKDKGHEAVQVYIITENRYTEKEITADRKKLFNNVSGFKDVNKYAFALFQSPEQARDAVKYLDLSWWHDRPLRCWMARKAEPKKGRKTTVRQEVGKQKVLKKILKKPSAGNG